MHLYELHNIRHAYNGKPVLTIDHCNVPADTVTGVVGPNGSGKSTLLCLLGFVNKPTRGEILYDGHPSAPFDDRVRGKVAMLTQDSILLKRSVYSNIAYGLRIKKDKDKERRRVQEALEMVGLDPEAFVRRPWFALSGGESRRVALAARMVLRPKVLLLDEPTNSVDAASAQMIKEAALHARQHWDTTLIISSHDGEWLADISDNILHLFRGRILGNGKRTLIFGPWRAKGMGAVTKTFSDGQIFEAQGAPTDLNTGVAAIEAKHMALHLSPAQIPPLLHRLKGPLLRLSYEQSIGRISAAVLVGRVVLNVYLEQGQAATYQFTPGQDVWVGYDPKAVKWY
ncbi:MAG: ABC transporter ATP-binding protein [Desulfobacteraceae bacterium]|jgi:tungstate transport system ATP-binding protein